MNERITITADGIRLNGRAWEVRRANQVKATKNRVKRAQKLLKEKGYCTVAEAKE